MYLRFVANHQLYTGKGYVRSKKHVNYNVSFEHYRFMYGVVIGLLSIKPNVHSVIHLRPSKTLEEYSQEPGRAGQDGQNSDASV